MKKQYRKPLVRIEKCDLNIETPKEIDSHGKGTIKESGTKCFEKETKMRELGGKESETV